MQGEQFRARARRDGVGATLIVAELYEQRAVVKLLNDCADLPPRKSLRGTVRQQRHDGQQGRPLVLCILCCVHQSTQQVTKTGRLSPTRTIQIVLTTALFSCRLIVASMRQ